MYAEFINGKKYGQKNSEISDSLDTFEDAGYILTDNDLVVDIDDLSKDQIKAMIEHFGLKTETVWTTRGAHLYFAKPKGFRRAKGVIALGFRVEYKHAGNTYATTVKQHGMARVVDNSGVRLPIPNYLQPGKDFKELLGMGENDGRNNALFLHRQQLAVFKNWRLIINFINQHVFEMPLDPKEIETLCREMVVDAVKDGESLIADTIMSEKRVVKYSDQLYFYQKGEYIGDDEYLKRLVFEYCPGMKTQYIDEVIKQMEYRSKLIPNDRTFDIKFKNGILRNGDFTEVDYTDFTPYSIASDYDPEAKPVEIVDSYLGHLTDHDMNYQLRLMEVLGHCLIVNKEFKRLMGKFFIFVGDGGNGKGTLLAVIRAILDTKNCSGLSIRNLTDERYLNVLQGKLANLGDDIQDEPINNEQMKMLKNISTCDFVEIRKLYKNSNTVELTPTLIFTSNHIIKSFEKGESYRRRVDWLPMYGRPKKKDKHFISKLTAEDSIKYWIRLIVEGYMRLYQNQKFTDSVKIDEFNQSYHEENNSAIAYLRDLTKEDLIDKRSPEVHELYEIWAKENGLGVQSNRSFQATVKIIFDLIVKPSKLNGKTARVYRPA